MTTKRVLSLLIVMGSLVPLEAQQFKVIYSFGAPGEPANPTICGTISQTPGGSLISSATGMIQSVKGAAYEMSLAGNDTVLEYFNAFPYSGLTMGTDERFHGTIGTGGKYGRGAVFRISPPPSSEVIYEHDFAGGTDGSLPYAAPIQSMAGDFYGVTSGAYSPDTDYGTVYRITKSGVYSVLHTFNYQDTDGFDPMCSLVQGSDGSFYGTTEAGEYMAGTIFRINSDGAFKELYQFDGTIGAAPDGPLIQASDGNLYGLTQGGGTALNGTAFKITPGGTLTVLYSFQGDDGAYPQGGLVEASDGNFYGTLYYGGQNGVGTLFRLTPDGVFTKIHDFDAADGESPMGTLFQHTNGKLYGQAYLGGAYNGGTLFEYDAGLPPFATYLNVYGVVGARVVILGQGFVDGLSTVSFNGVAAQDPEIYPTYIKATVPEGATTGPITVTTGLNTLKSNKVFVVH
jgi:uncharacterized repeat protein (TIGR03803 family)